MIDHIHKDGIFDIIARWTLCNIYIDLFTNCNFKKVLESYVLIASIAPRFRSNSVFISVSNKMWVTRDDSVSE